MGGCGSKDNGAEGVPATTTTKTATATATGGASTQAATDGKRFREPSTVLDKAAPAVSDNADTGAHHVKNIFAKKLNFDSGFKPPVHHKTRDEKHFILKALQNNFVFENMAPRELDPLVMAFEKSSANQGGEIIKQGDTGDFFYILEQGRCAFQVNGVEVGQATETGSSFGELALLYSAPRAATVTALDTPTKFYRVDQTTFRYILQNQTQEGTKTKFDLLRKIPFLQDLGDEEMGQLASAMTPHPFAKDEYLLRKGEDADFFYVLQEGSLKVTDIQVGDSKYEDVVVKPGGYVGERALVTGEPRAANVICMTDGLAFYIDKPTFETVLGGLNAVILRSQDQRQLSAIKIIKDSHYDTKFLVSLARRFKDQEFKTGDVIIEEGEMTEAALYFPRAGLKLELTDKAGTRKETLEVGGYFGDDQLLADVQSGKNSMKDTTNIRANYTVKVLEGGACGLLTLAECRKVVDTKFIGKVMAREMTSPMIQVTMQDLQRHSILGAGTFGQVWLVSMKKDKKKKGYALKIQSKYELARDGQAKAVIDEKNIMAQLHHPFIINLVSAFQDKKFVYMLLELVQGGELFSLLHSRTGDGVPEANAKFYAASVADGLAFMHRLSIVYRDLKPENVLIGADGYAVIIDFGFAKFVKDKTYTLCGTPLYLAPEVILNRGHNHGADHWSLGVLIYEMISGDTPFYKSGMEQMDLFRSIVKGNFAIPSSLSPEAADIVTQLLKKNPTKRLGSLANREDDIYGHSWLSSVDFDALRDKEITAPFKPDVKDPLDSSNFDNWDHLPDKISAKHPLLNAEEGAIFKDF